MAYIPPNPNGNATAANSSPVTLASDNNGPVKVGDGTNTVNVLKSDGTAAGQSSLLTGSAYLDVSFTTTTVQAVGTTDVANYSWVSVHITSQGTSSTVNFQGSNDNINWVSVVMSANASQSNAMTSSETSVAIRDGPLHFRYFRLNVTGISAGTTAGVIHFSALPTAPHTMGVGAQQISTWTVQPGNTANTTPWLVTATAAGDVASGATDSGNPVKAGAVYESTPVTYTTGQRTTLHTGTRGSLAVQLSLPDSSTAVSFSGAADGTANPSVASRFEVINRNTLYNGTTWDRMYSASAVAGTTGTGLLGAGILGFDGTNYQRLKTDTSGNQFVGGDVASAASDSGNPIKIGTKYNSTQPTFTDGQRAELQVTSRGELRTILTSNGTSITINTNGGADGTTNTTNVLNTRAYTEIYNGTSWDMLRSRTGASTGTLAVSDLPATSGGLSIVTGSVGGTATAIKASAGQLYGYHLFNTTAAVAYVQIFNVAVASVTLGTTAPTLSIGIPASGGVTVNFDKGVAFGTAISYACTTTRAGSTGATCDVNFFYN